VSSLAAPGRETGARPAAVRDRVLAVASVSCANSACLELHRRLPDVVPVVHQHGCSQIGLDLALTREILAALMANPNVGRSVVIGLGCESNQPDELAVLARARGALVEVVGIQSSGGVEAAVADAQAALLRARPAARRPASGEPAPRVGVLADDSTGSAGAELADRIAAALVEAGFAVVVSAAAEPVPAAAAQPARGAAVPLVWRGSRASPLEALAQLAPRDEPRFEVRAGTGDVERLTALTAVGATVAVVLTASASPIGSPLAPTVKVSCDDGCDGLADIVDVPYRGGRRLVARVVDAVAVTARGHPTQAERSGVRDVALWRLAPYF
jgi:altronate dehydratase